MARCSCSPRLSARTCWVADPARPTTRACDCGPLVSDQVGPILGQPLNSRLLSRVQLNISVGDEALSVENVGRAPLLHGDRETQTAQVRSGNTIQIGGQLLLLCVRRPSFFTGEPVDETSHAFGEPDRDGIVGESEAAWQLRRRIGFVAPRAGHVLVAGASGTGKELVAKALHAHSPQGHRPLVARNAATIPEGLIDAELFGNAKNFPNPGMAERPGIIGQADGYIAVSRRVRRAADRHAGSPVARARCRRVSAALARRPPAARFSA